jgi:hypothetical protein
MKINSKMIFIPSSSTVSSKTMSIHVCSLCLHSSARLFSSAGKNERDGPRRNEFCPFDFFDGEIKFDYYLNEDKVCSGFESTLSQCPSGSTMSFRFKGCNHPVSSANLECIGMWQASNQHYLAVIDWINGTTPRYKCGVS